MRRLVRRSAEMADRWSLRLTLAGLLAIPVAVVAAQPQPRYALVIGNASYTAAPLANPVNDARDVAAKLSALGFEVTALENAGLRRMRTALAEFGQRLTQSPDAAALFYFAGHGIQSRGRNYLLPVDAAADTEARARAAALKLDDVLEELQYRGSGVNLVILDACRNNPFEDKVRGVGRGLARVATASGTLVAYATAPGSVAEDGTGRNGVYTAALLEVLERPGLNEDQVFKKVGVLVEARTGGQQRPWREGSLRGDFVFNAPMTVKVAPTLVQSSIGAADRETVFWQSVQDSENVALYEAYLAQFPDGVYAPIAKVKVAELQPDARVALANPALDAAAAPTRPSVQVPQREHIESLLSAAARDVSALRLTSPRGNNAVERYREVLSLDPDNARAAAGLGDVVARYIALAEQSAGRGNRSGIERYLQRAQSVQPGSARLKAARERLLVGAPIPPVETAVGTSVPPSDGLESTRQSQAAARRERVATLLARAATDVAANRLASPAGNNAVERYREVLSLEPDNARATAGRPTSP